jgi:arginase
VAGGDWVVNAPALPEGAPLERMGVLYEALAGQVAAAVRAGRRPVSLAGDCLSCLGVTAGLQRAGVEAALLWFDAHGDFNTPETSPSGFLGGMPLAMAVGRGDQTLVRRLGMRPVAEERVILTDARDLDPGEDEAVAASAMTHLPGVAALLDGPLPSGPLHVHFDTDIVDPIESPAQNYLVPGGPSAELLGRVFRRIGRDGDVVAVSISAWNPAMAETWREMAASPTLKWRSRPAAMVPTW